ncbi:MAG TPA: hypothetical protein VHT70_05250 [Candidatus Saccharimonadales bacterium]|jgi:hypothetical protein|nr:hypothetical protein [Candidatus Saccharimonadales bacterium]
MAALAVVLLISPAAVQATSAATFNRGLLISPLREYVNIAAGQSLTRAVTIANLTEKPMDVSLSVAQFSVADYTYRYRFAPTQHDWVHLSQSTLQLQPGKNARVPYQIAIPAGTAPGGHYFTIFANTRLQSGNVTSNVQAATVLYTTIQGNLVESSSVVRSHLPWLSFGKALPFTLDVKDTGNTHFFVYASGQLHGLSAQPSPTEATHLLLPGAIRTIGGSIAPPLLPGIYKATYGYRTENNQTVTRSHYIFFVPPWSLTIPIGLGWIGLVIWRRRPAHRSIRS